MSERPLFHGPRLLVLACILAILCAGYVARREAELDYLREKHSGPYELLVDGLPRGPVALDLVRSAHLWQALEPPRVLEPADDSFVGEDGARSRVVTFTGLAAGGYELRWEDHVCPLLLTESIRIDLTPPPAGFARIPPGPFFARLTFELERPLDPEGRPHGSRGFLIALSEVSVADYREFLVALGRRRGRTDDAPIDPRQQPLPFTPWCGVQERRDSPQGCLGHRPVAGGADQWALQDEPGKQDLPVRFTSWHDAMAYCAYLTDREGPEAPRVRYRLPTRSEWEKAARGVDGRPFPWGFDPLTPAQRGMVGRMSVTSHPHLRSPYGPYHMGSGVAEWSLTPEGARRRHVLGTSWDVHSDQIHTGYAVGENPFFRATSIGFRVVREEPR